MITTQNKWKDRTQLPVYKKLTQFKFDPVLLLKSYNEIKDKDWNAMTNEYSKFTESHNIVTNKFSDQYQQYGLTEFDSNYDIANRLQKSGSIWDRKIAKSNPYADERYYRKRKYDIPSYINEVLNIVGKDVVHKTRFAKLPAGKAIKKHIDHDTKYGIRLHIPIITNDKSVYGGTGSDGITHETHFPADGGVWFINPGVPHWVHNYGDTERVHLIISCDTQEILNEN